MFDHAMKIWLYNSSLISTFSAIRKDVRNLGKCMFEGPV